MLFGFFACTPDPGPGDQDDSPGVDEYFHVTIDGNLWEENNDDLIGAVLGDFGSGPTYGFTATRSADSSYFLYNVPYFMSNDTTWDLSSVPTGFAFTFNTDSIYNEAPSGNLHIVRTQVQGQEVFTGTFNYTGLELLHNSPATFSSGEFVIARLL